MIAEAGRTAELPAVIRAWARSGSDDTAAEVCLDRSMMTVCQVRPAIAPHKALALAYLRDVRVELYAALSECCSAGAN